MVTNSEVKDSIRSLEQSQFSAKGADLTLAVCGWQPASKLEFTRIVSDLFADSTKSRGRGYLYIDARGRGFACTGKIFFTYTAGYSGGHGSYEGYTNFALFQRENPVPLEVSEPGQSAPLALHEERNGILHTASRTLPDGSLADFYSIVITQKTALRIQVHTVDTGQSFRPRAFAYQNQRFRFKDDENEIVQPGGLHVFVTSGLETGRYRIKIVELTEAEKSGLAGWP